MKVANFQMVTLEEMISFSLKEGREVDFNPLKASFDITAFDPANYKLLTYQKRTSRSNYQTFVGASPDFVSFTKGVKDLGFSEDFSDILDDVSRDEERAKRLKKDAPTLEPSPKEVFRRNSKTYWSRLCERIAQIFSREEDVVDCQVNALARIYARALSYNLWLKVRHSTTITPEYLIEAKYGLYIDPRDGFGRLTIALEVSTNSYVGDEDHRERTGVEYVGCDGLLSYFSDQQSRLFPVAKVWLDYLKAKQIIPALCEYGQQMITIAEMYEEHYNNSK